MSGVLPHPRLSLAVAVMWLLLNDSLAPGHVLIAVVMGLVIPRACGSLLSPLPAVRRPWKLLAYLAIVTWDIVTATIRVAVLVLGPSRRWRPCFVSVPLDVSDPVVVGLLAATVTLTPGTVSVRADPTQRRLDVHALGVDDPDAIVVQIKSRYERRLKEIFSC